MTADEFPPAPKRGADAPPDARAYAYTHAQTLGSTGYFSFEPAEPLPLEAALAAYCGGRAPALDIVAPRPRR
ncbi:MAG: hypothetical protein K2G99_04395, partial [Desulfovibrio sp.]|nr:hypothetical protein [Desulfovibrio sp.]